MELFDAEYKLMTLLWENEPLGSTELWKLCGEAFGWKKPTTFNLIKKLEQKGVLKNEDATVTSCISRENIQAEQSRQVVEKTFGGSLPSFLTSFLGERKLSKDELQELQKIIEEARE